MPLTLSWSVSHQQGVHAGHHTSLTPRAALSFLLLFRTQTMEDVVIIQTVYTTRQTTVKSQSWADTILTAQASSNDLGL